MCGGGRDADGFCCTTDRQVVVVARRVANGKVESVRIYLNGRQKRRDQSAHRRLCVLVNYEGLFHNFKQSAKAQRASLHTTYGGGAVFVRREFWAVAVIYMR